MLRLPEICEAPNVRPLTSLMVTSLALLMLTGLIKSSLWLKVILLAAPADKLVLPVTEIFPLSAIAPLAVTDKLPVTLTAGSVTPALSYWRVRLLSVAGRPFNEGVGAAS